MKTLKFQLCIENLKNEQLVNDQQLETFKIKWARIY